MSKKGVNIYKRKDGRWESRYPKGYAADGKIRYGYCCGKTYREAKEKAENKKCNSLLGKNPQYSESKKKFISCCDEWLQLRRSKVKESTLVKYKTNLENHIKPALGGFYISALSSLAVEQFGYDLLYEKKLSAKTVRDILSQLNSILKYTAKQYIYMPSIEISYPKENLREMRVLSREEQNRFMEYLLNNMNYCKFGTLLALLTGMRIGEICALRWKDIYFETQTLKVSSTMQRLQNLDISQQRKTKIIIRDPKSATSARTIPMTDFTLELCKSMKVDCPSAFVLTGKQNSFIEPRSLQYRFSKYVRDCGLKGVHFHALRHTFATRCVEVGFDIKSLSEILGHANPKITLERYVHSSLELKRNNMNKLSSVGY